MPDRIYSPEEAAAIIGRVAERQRERPAPSVGLTLPELERACDEAGLDAGLVREAAAELDAGRLALDPGRPGTVVAERWADAPFRLDAWEDAVAALRVRSGGSMAEPSRLGDSHEWAHTTAFGSRTTVTVSPRGERTRVRVVTVDEVVNARRQAALVTAFLAAVPAMLLGALVAEGFGWGDLAGVLAVVLTMVAGVAVGAPLVERRTHRRRERQSAEAERLADDLVRRLGSVGPASEPELLPRAADPVGPRLSLDLDEPAPDDEAAARSRRRTRS